MPRRSATSPVRAPARPPTLETPLRASGLVAPATARRLERLELRTVRDLLFHLPRLYHDFSRPHSLRELREAPPAEAVSATVTVVDLRTEQTFRRRVQRTLARLSDASGEGEAIWFGRRFVERRLHPGDDIAIAGKVRVVGWLPQFQNPDFGPAGVASLHAGRIVPVYRLTEGVSLTVLRRAIRSALDAVGDAYPEYLPAALRLDAPGPPLVAIGAALEAAHYPDDFLARDAALRRLAWDELLALQLGMVARGRRRRGEAGRAIAVDPAWASPAVASLEATLTGMVRRRRVAAAGPERHAEAEAEAAAFQAHLTPDQLAAVDAVRRDLAGPRPMLRLLQGDVGSGKTAVAALALAFVAQAGHQGALLAPTDLLARQHAATLGLLLEPLGQRVTLLTGSLPAARRRAALDLLGAPPAAPGPDGRLEGRVVVGTHALVQDAVAFADLALAIIDEQHRFGVAQREALAAKGTAPHVLLMTATPIPRTLGQVLHADLDVSDLRTPPAGRLPITTGVRSSPQLERVADDPGRGTWPLVVGEVARGHRAFVVVPLVEEDEATGARSAAATAERLGELLPRVAAALGRDLVPRIGVVHGQLRAGERDAVMERFRAGDLDVLVGTTVIEVGVDVPEATVMVVLDADRFGVAQLHQLRGRVGRGEARSYCILVSDSDDATAQARLQALVETQDGFVLAEQDLQLRRAGELLGLSQSGLPPLRVARLQDPADQARSREARRIAETLLDAGGELLPGLEPLAAELRHGWLARVGAGDVLATAGEEPVADAPAVAAAGAGPAGSGLAGVPAEAREGG